MVELFRVLAQAILFPDHDASEETSRFADDISLEYLGALQRKLKETGREELLVLSLESFLKGGEVAHISHKIVRGKTPTFVRCLKECNHGASPEAIENVVDVTDSMLVYSDIEAVDRGNNYHNMVLLFSELPITSRERALSTVNESGMFSFIKARPGYADLSGRGFSIKFGGREVEFNKIAKIEALRRESFVYHWLNY